jgi:hypothetical protein
MDLEGKMALAQRLAGVREDEGAEAPQPGAR